MHENKDKGENENQKLTCIVFDRVSCSIFLTPSILHQLDIAFKK